jgi:hypothetical protein
MKIGSFSQTIQYVDKILKEKICVLDLQVHKALAKAH